MALHREPRPTRLTIDGTDVEIRRSARRSRTIQARVEGDGVVVLAPATMSPAEERRAVEDLVRRVMRKGRSQRNDAALMRRAMQMSTRYVPGAPEPTSVRWVSNMTTRWASCSPADGSIRVSDVMIGMPNYVLDAVLLHEVAHLVERGHGPAFQRLVRRNPHHERAEAYLAGASFGARRRAADLPPASLDDSDDSDDLGDPGVAGGPRDVGDRHDAGDAGSVR